MFRSFLRLIDRLARLETAYAHCDVPCGVYNIHAAATGAETVRVMTEKLTVLEQENHHDSGFHNTFVRMVVTKEEHAQIVKSELHMLWSDFFKEEHLEMFSDLHETFWKATKLCSQTKREVNLDAAKELEAAVAKVGEMIDKVNAAA